MVSDQTLRTDLWNDIRTVLVSAAIQSTIGSTVKSASIVAAYNDQSTSKPQIVIYPINPEETLDKFGGYSGRININVMVDCFSNSSLASDQLADQASYALKTASISGVELINISSDNDSTGIGGEKYNLVSLSINYLRE